MNRKVRTGRKDMTKEMFFVQMKRDAELLNSAIENLYSVIDKQHIDKLVDAELYSLMAGGKRIRPIIALAFCRLFGGKDEAVLSYACALEMVHTSSLIHDDLPCMDNDELRRGKPTNHMVYGESIALLAGDGMIADALGLVAKNKHVVPELNLQAVETLAYAAGMYGIAGGQYIDASADKSLFEVDDLEKMYSYKTGALLRASAIMGAISAGVSLEDDRMNDVIIYANSIGLAFQIVDDILDETGTVELLGKNPGRDKKEKKVTYLNFYTIHDSFNRARRLTQKAIAAIEKYDNNEFLIELANYLLNRKN